VFCPWSAFTLVELLVVIAIVGLLAALLLSPLFKAKVKSQSLICKSNLHQLGLALGMYVQDSTGVYPYTASLPVVSSRGIAFWFDALAWESPSLNWGDGTLKCPAYKGVVYAGEITSNNRGELKAVYAPCGSYAYNAAGRRGVSLGRSGALSAGLGFSVYAGSPMEQPIRESDVREPADLYAIGDSPISTAPWGKVETPRAGGAADYNMFATDSAAIESTQHPTSFNMLLADLHVESTQTNFLLSPNQVYRARWNHDHLP
jgi:prepilin-type N-terminal cleavage/methylation domain-containing protein